MSIPRFLALLSLVALSPAATAAVNCGDILFSSDGLAGDLDCNSGFVAVEIRGNDVVLDLNGYTLGGSILEGIVVTADRVTVRGPGIIKGFQIGMQASNANRVTVRDVDFVDVNTGITMVGARNALIVRNRFENLPGIGVNVRGFDNGTTVRPSSGNRIRRNVFRRVATGVNVCGYNATHQRIEENRFRRVLDYGIQLETGTNHNLVANNWFYNLDNTGIRITNANMNQVTSNYLEAGRVGISIHDNDGHTNPSCAQPPSLLAVTGNLVEGNSIHFHDIAVELGLGIVTTPVVIANQVDTNKLYDNQFGLWFRGDAWMNQAPGNVFTGTVTPVVDAGTGNVY